MGDFIDLLKVFVRRPSVVGSEQSFFRALRRELDELGIGVTQYQGMLVAEGDRPDSGYRSAHVDRHGLICTGPNEFEYAAFAAQHRGDLLGDSVSERTFHTIVGRFEGQRVIAYDPWSGAYLGQGVIRGATSCPARANVVFDVEGLDHVLPGTPLGYQDRLRVEDERAIAQLDNVLTVAMLVHGFQVGYRGTAFFTTQEESGRSWRFLREWFLRKGVTTSELLVVDTSPYGSRAEAEAQQLVLRRRDANAPFNAAAVERVEAACRQGKISFAYKDEQIEERNEQRRRAGRSALSLGSTELGRVIATSDGAIDGTTLQVPTTGYHTSEETASMASVEACLSVLEALT